jgi:accessory gene regulator protein AgrB
MYEDRESKKLHDAINKATILDLLFLIPSSFLFYYLPSENLFQILCSLIIVIFFAIGLFTTIHVVVECIKRRKKRHTFSE